MNAHSPIGHKVRVLVVEDEPLISMLLETMLEDAGCDVVATASSLKAGLAALDGRELDLAILDMTLGQESSFPIADVLQERGVPFMFASGHGATVLPAKHANRQVLAKPFAQSDLELKLAAIGLG